MGQSGNVLFSVLPHYRFRRRISGRRDLSEAAGNGALSENGAAISNLKGLNLLFKKLSAYIKP